MRRVSSNARGVSLVEVMIAMVILTSMAGGLSALLLTSGRQARDAGKLSFRAAVLNAEVSRIAALPPNALVDGTVTQTHSGLPLAYTMTTVAVTSGITQTVTITLTPTGTRPIGGLSRTIVRKAGSTSPFN
jgi:prepilin-type N-terminal cleavage/methylation domain-containing protein